MTIGLFLILLAILYLGTGASIGIKRMYISLNYHDKAKWYEWIGGIAISAVIWPWLLWKYP